MGDKPTYAECLKASRIIDEDWLDDYPGQIPTDGWNSNRPCVYCECRYHLDHPDASCALDVAASGPQTQERIAELMGVSQPAVAKFERKAREKLSKNNEYRNAARRQEAT